MRSVTVLAMESEPVEMTLPREKTDASSANDSAETIAKNEFILTDELKKRGWTKTMIERFIPYPDDRSGWPIVLYSRDRALAIERSEEWVAAREKSLPRREAAQRGVETKIKNLLNYVDETNTAVLAMSDAKLTQDACDSYNALPWTDDWATPSSDEAFLLRIKVNYLRHKMTPYKEKIEDMLGKTGKKLGLIALRDKIFASISEVYPDLADECTRQKNDWGKYSRRRRG